MDRGNYLALRTLLVGWVQENSSIDQGAVYIGHHGAHVPGPIGSTAVLEGEGETRAVSSASTRSSSGLWVQLLCPLHSRSSVLHSQPRVQQHYVVECFIH